MVGKVYDFTLWLLPKVEQFPRSYRFTVGERVVATVLDLLVLLVEAAYATEKLPTIENAGRRANVLRYLLRLRKDLRLLSLDSYKFAAGRLEEISRMVGGWQKWASKR